ncbi:type VII secretion target [Mycobacterium sp. 48b]|uniref:type VII secretion target n=1 Tax=Mycobacterium sp. 48b TaxID=3400426 RepID=UPI003AB0B35F
MGDQVKVSAEGLHALADQCDATAAALTGSINPSSGGLPRQATTTAVQQGSSLVEVTAAVLASRVTETAKKLRTAATSYTSTDDGAANRIAATGQSVEA